MNCECVLLGQFWKLNNSLLKTHSDRFFFPLNGLFLFSPPQPQLYFFHCVNIISWTICTQTTTTTTCYRTWLIHITHVYGVQMLFHNNITYLNCQLNALGLRNFNHKPQTHSCAAQLIKLQTVQRRVHDSGSRTCKQNEKK